ncbi:MAG TPA: hypothetical protein P5511_08680, partial [Candidatus Goldiibacteriota bacterium]|nr:hypothetical protein [Candidatus Goldiibacteriota bacterium]
MALSLTSTASSIQIPVSYLGVNHVNKMPAYAAKGQQWVYAEDIVFTHPDPSGRASVSLRGITLTVEDALGAAMIPSTALAGITVLDAANNTVFSSVSMPSSGTQVYLDFGSLLINPSASAVLKVYIRIPASPSAAAVKLNLNSPSMVN